MKNYSNKEGEGKKGRGRWIKCGKILLDRGAGYIFESFQNERKAKERKNGEQVPAGGISHLV